ncbi:hypothetical protein C8F04DRAFT_1181963 [Mycena alexandri]|uniref:Uncharacterized protein n=1 Tax=Mycena alexandri TaxID=1745969 RepID=A0AAD6SYD8_9AGAR|nr:hypothetical protein C8F04DRAFT_1181963 [Mycena alexandri]
MSLLGIEPMHGCMTVLHNNLEGWSKCAAKQEGTAQGAQSLTTPKTTLTMHPRASEKAAGKESADEGVVSTAKRPKVQPGVPPPPVFLAPPEDPPQETVPHQGFPGLFLMNLQDFQKSLTKLKKVPQQHWMFDVHSITTNS